VLVAPLVLAGCPGGDDDDPTGGQAAVYTLLVLEALRDLPPTTDPDALPVVYVVSVGEDPIAAKVQADVAGDLRDDADIKFADHRDEAVMADDEGAPVRDGGLLVAVSGMPDDPRGPFDVDVELYRSDDDRVERVMTIDAASAGWTVTSTSVVEPD
jgi:hypothetical protein